jgi:hypothetical protein
MSIETLQIFMAILFFLIGAILGVIATMTVTNMMRRSQQPTARKKAREDKGRYQEIVHILRDPSSGQVVTGFQNRTVSDVNLFSAKERDYLHGVAKEWQKWLGLPAPEAALLPELATPVLKADAEKAAAGASALPAAQSATPARAAAPLGRVAELLTPVNPLSIVEQVDEILQEKLVEQPSLGKVIKLAEDPREGVVVWVNMKKHVGITSVTDPEIRAIIHSAVVEWERRNEHKSI